MYSKWKASFRRLVQDGANARIHLFVLVYHRHVCQPCMRHSMPELTETYRVAGYLLTVLASQHFSILLSKSVFSQTKVSLQQQIIKIKKQTETFEPLSSKSEKVNCVNPIPAYAGLTIILVYVLFHLYHRYCFKNVRVDGFSTTEGIDCNHSVNGHKQIQENRLPFSF